MFIIIEVIKMGTFLIILIFIVLAILCFSVEKNNMTKADNWKQEQNKELQKLGISNTIEYYYADSNFAYTARYIVDNSNKKIAIYSSSPGFVKNDIKVINFNGLLGCEIFVDSQTCGSTNRAIAGGVLAGFEGAVIGALTTKKEISSLKIVFYLKNINNPEYTITLINSNTKINSSDYTKAEDFSRKVSASVKAILHECNNINTRR